LQKTQIITITKVTKPCNVITKLEPDISFRCLANTFGS